MSLLQERLTEGVSDSELERRWRLTREAMRRHGVDALVVQGSNEFYAGYVRWLTDIPGTNGNFTTVVFHREDDMVIVAGGPKDGVTHAPSGRRWEYRGVKKVITAPYMTPLSFTAGYDAQAAAAELKNLLPSRIAVAAPNAMSATFLDTLRRQLRVEGFVDLTDDLDAIKAIKSDEEVALIRRCAALQDQVFERVLTVVRPGMRDFEIVAAALHEAQRLGSENGIFLAASAPLGVAGIKVRRRLMNRALQPGDQFTILIEVNGVAGYYTEIGRTCVLGKANTEMQDEFAFARSAQDFTTSLFVAGAEPAEIFSRYNDYMRSNKRPPERRLHAHGQGYDLVERPAIRDDETMRLAANMNLACHPTYVTERTYTWICDNYLLRPDGEVERLHKTPQQIFEL